MIQAKSIRWQLEIFQIQKHWAVVTRQNIYLSNIHSWKHVWYYSFVRFCIWAGTLVRFFWRENRLRYKHVARVRVLGFSIVYMGGIAVPGGTSIFLVRSTHTICHLKTVSSRQLGYRLLRRVELEPLSRLGWRSGQLNYRDTTYILNRGWVSWVDRFKPGQ